MRQGTIVTVKPDGHPLSVTEAKRQLRIEPEDTEQDDHIADLCAAAHRFIERQLGYPILRQMRATHLSGFPCGSVWPIGAVWLGGGDSPAVVTIQYRDTAGTLQTLDASAFHVDAVSIPAMICPAVRWPDTKRQPSAVIVTWQAGWDSPADVPEDLLQAMKLLVGHWDQNREAVVIGTISSEVQVALDDLLSPFRIPFVA